MRNVYYEPIICRDPREAEKYVRHHIISPLLILAINHKHFCSSQLSRSIINNIRIKTVILNGKESSSFEKVLIRTNKQATQKVRLLEKKGVSVNRDIPLHIAVAENMQQAYFMARVFEKNKKNVVFLECLLADNE